MLRCSIVLKVERSLAQADDLTMFDAVCWIGHGARRLRRHMQRDLLAGGKPAVQHIPALAAIRVLPRSNICETKDLRPVQVDGLFIHSARRNPTLPPTLAVNKLGLIRTRECRIL